MWSTKSETSTGGAFAFTSPMRASTASCTGWNLARYASRSASLIW